MLLKLALFVLAIVLLAKLFRRRKRGAKGSAPVRTEVNRWVDHELSRELAKRLTLGPNMVKKALQGEPEPEVVGSIEQAVRSVELSYAKAASDAEIEVRLDVTFEDGSVFTTSRVLPLGEVPEAVRAEYKRTGSARVYRPYLFPWSS